MIGISSNSTLPYCGPHGTSQLASLETRMIKMVMILKNFAGKIPGKFSRKSVDKLF
jgi:hypothetical protein